MKFLTATVLIIFCCSFGASAQNTLPDFSVNNLGGKIIVSWKNAYTKPIANLNIQRSYDSLQNFTTIGTVLNPENLENGYLDVNPPYNRMYYRIFVSFEGGAYLFSQSKSPERNNPTRIVKTADGRDSIVNNEPTALMPWQINPMLDANIVKPQPGVVVIPASKRIYSGTDAVILNLPYATSKIYTIRFYDEKQKLIFELKNIKEDFLILDKVNFGKSGTYNFEIFEDGILIEKNVVIVPKDAKKN